jgi:hypothetical protein
MSTLQAGDEAAAFKRPASGAAASGEATARSDSSGVIECGRLQWRRPAGRRHHGKWKFCYGNTGQRFWLVSKLANGGWRRMTSSPGIPEFLKTKGVDGWPDVLVGGPGFCFRRTVNGKEYKLHDGNDGKVCALMFD